MFGDKVAVAIVAVTLSGVMPHPEGPSGFLESNTLTSKW